MKLWTPKYADNRHIRDQVYSKRDMRLKFVKNIPNKKKTYTLCISPVITKRGDLDTQFLLVFHDSKALGVCTYCKGIRYQQSSHDCKVLKKHPGLVPEDLTIDNTEWLMKDPYEYYWFNWEGAVKYGEILMRKTQESTTAKKEKRQFEASSQKQSP